MLKINLSTVQCSFVFVTDTCSRDLYHSHILHSHIYTSHQSEYYYNDLWVMLLDNWTKCTNNSFSRHAFESRKEFNQKIERRKEKSTKLSVEVSKCLKFSKFSKFRNNLNQKKKTEHFTTTLYKNGSQPFVTTILGVLKMYLWTNTIIF